MAWGPAHPWHWCLVSPSWASHKAFCPPRLLCQGDWNISLKGYILFHPPFRKIHTYIFPSGVCCHSHMFSENEPSHPQLGCRAAFELLNPASRGWWTGDGALTSSGLIKWSALMIEVGLYWSYLLCSGTRGLCDQELLGQPNVWRSNCKRKGWDKKKAAICFEEMPYLVVRKEAKYNLTHIEMHTIL